MFVSCTVFVLSDRGLCERPISRPEESYRLWCMVEEGRTTKRLIQSSVGNYDGLCLWAVKI
jgi:hypothetical protein